MRIVPSGNETSARHREGVLKVRDALAELAAACGFAGQRRMTRHFRNAYGMPPGRWATLTAGESWEPERPGLLLKATLS